MDFKEARQRVSIVQIAEHLGYAYNKAKGRIRPQYEHPNGDKIVISFPQDNSRQMYFNRDGSTDRGTVIEFVKQRLRDFNNVNYTKDMDGVNQVLKHFANEPITKSIAAPPQYKPPFLLEKEVFDLKTFKISELPTLSNENDYLRKRGINEQTIAVFQKDIRLVTDIKSKTGFANVGFPYKNTQDEIVGIEVRNHKFKGHARGSDKDTGVWKAAMRPFNEQIKNAFLFESAIDALSFYQLYHAKFNFKDAAFISFGGSLTPNQMDNVIHSYQNARFFAGFDRDANGHIYDYAFEKRLNPTLDLDVKRVGETFIIKHKGTEYKLPHDDFSMKKVAELTGVKIQLYVTKPSVGNDYNEMLQHFQKEMGERRVVKY